MTTHLEEVAGGIYRLELYIKGIPTVFTVYLIREDGNALVEPGPAVLVPDILAAAADTGIHGFKYIFPTHIHQDHAGGLGRLAQVFPQAEIVVNRQAARHAIEPSRLIRSTEMAFGVDFADTFGQILPVPEANITVAADGDVFYLGERELRVFDTPGHAGHHVVIYDTRTGGLFCGEALGLIFTTGTPPLPAVAAPSFDLEVYLATMRRLQELRPAVLYYSHGGIGTEPDKQIPAIIENAQVVGDFILNLLKAGNKPAAIIQAVDDLLREKYGARLGDYDLSTTVGGYIHYFRKKGLVQGPG
ncbi:MBL fold metallo-hydrolase [Chloroflexota bacterium]